jgi:multidrug efflux pump subunit AcrB
LSGKGLSEQQLYGAGMNFMRTHLMTVGGAVVPGPYGNKVREMHIDLNRYALQSRGLSAQEVGNAISAKTQIIPAGYVKIGALQYNLTLNNASADVHQLEKLELECAVSPCRPSLEAGSLGELSNRPSVCFRTSIVARSTPNNSGR